METGLNIYHTGQYEQYKTGSKTKRQTQTQKNDKLLAEKTKKKSWIQQISNMSTLMFANISDISFTNTLD